MLGRKELKNRDTWQDKSTDKSVISERDFYSVLNNYFIANGNEFRIRKNPAEFKTIYVNVALTDEVASKIYTPDKEIKIHGITPDCAIENTRNSKTIYIEIKRQDGWVEGKPRNAGRGNAHERSCKYFTPGLLTALRKKGNIGKKHLPFWIVFQGDITRDPCRVREVTLWFENHTGNYFFWRDSPDSESLIRHFEKHIKPILL